MYPKFIITSAGELRLGQVRLHRDLLQPGDTCYGGGYFRFDYNRLELQLSGESSDFGPPRWLWIDALIVPAIYSDLTITYDGEILSATLPIKFS